MRGSRQLFLVGCLAVSVLSASAVYAGDSTRIAGGTITFVGALVEPTCGISTADFGNANDYAHGARPAIRQSCSGTAASPADASRTYNSSVVHLSGTESDQVLRYFAGYVRATQASSADPELVTQTYD